jgi:capsular polysaccharide biosynthesis protein/GGDEF domain-containing protein
VVPVFLLILFGSIGLRLLETPVYEASATFIVRPNVTSQDDFLSALGIVSRQTEIARTFAQVADSTAVKRQVVERLGPDQDLRDISLDARAIGGTNLLEVTVRGGDPQVITQYSAALGAVLVKYVNELYGTFSLATLDEASAPRSPLAPDAPWQLVLSVALAATVAAAAAFAYESWAGRGRRFAPLDIVDPQSGAFSDAYFHLRLDQEASRAREVSAPLSVASFDAVQAGLLLPERGAREQILTRFAAAVRSRVPPHQILARLDGDVFALLLPGFDEQRARSRADDVWTAAMAEVVQAPPAVIRTARAASDVVAFTGDRVEHALIRGRTRRRAMFSWLPLGIASRQRRYAPLPPQQLMDMLPAATGGQSREPQPSLGAGGQARRGKSRRDWPGHRRRRG